MDYSQELNALRTAASQLALEMASLRDEYLSFRGMPQRFSDLATAYSNLNIVGDTVFALSELKSQLTAVPPMLVCSFKPFCTCGAAVAVAGPAASVAGPHIAGDLARRQVAERRGQVRGRRKRRVEEFPASCGLIRLRKSRARNVGRAALVIDALVSS